MTRKFKNKGLMREQCERQILFVGTGSGFSMTDK